MWHPQTWDLVLVIPVLPPATVRAPNPRSQGHRLQSAGAARRGLQDGATALGRGAAGWWHWEAGARVGDESGKRSKTQTNKTGITEERNHPSARSRQRPAVTQCWQSFWCHGGVQSPPRTYGAPGGVWNSWRCSELPASPLFPTGPVWCLLLLHLQPAAAALVQPGQLEVLWGQFGQGPAKGDNGQVRGDEQTFHIIWLREK